MNRLLTRSLALGVAIALLLVGLHALGVRRSTTIIAGVAAAPTDTALALVYVAAWFVTVLVTPILVIASGLLWLDRWLRGRRASDDDHRRPAMRR